MSATTPALDGAVLDRLIEWGGDELLGRMIDLFLELAPTRIGEIERATAGGDWESAARAAHSLKSSAGNLGAEPLRQAATELEGAGPGSSPVELKALAERVCLTYSEAAQALRKLRHSLDRGGTA